MKTKAINNNIEGGTAAIGGIHKELPNIQTRPLLGGSNGYINRDKVVS